MTSARGPRVLVVQNTPGGGPARFGAWLRAEGLRLDVRRAYRGDPVPRQPDGFAAVMVLGGGFMPDDDTRAPWLAPARELAAGALRHGVPYFGICLGGQLLAHVAGGTVTADAGRPEVGSTPVTLLPGASDDPLFRDLRGTVPAIQRHRDEITALPPGAAWLARSDRCRHQAFRVGACAWGVQFHPEVPAVRVRHWDPERVRALGFDPRRVRHRATADERTSRAAWQTVARHFAGVARRHPDASSGQPSTRA